MNRLAADAATKHPVGGISDSVSSAMCEIERSAETIRLARGQSIEVRDPHPPVLIVRSGYLTVRAVVDTGGRIDVALVPSSHMIWLSTFRASAPLTLVAAAPTVLLRIEEVQFTQLIDREASVKSYALQQARRQNCYDQLHIALLSSLRGEERLAGFLLALAAQKGFDRAAGLTFELPVSRCDLAHHLALNADTLSRIVSRFRASGLIAMPNRRTVRIVDLEGLSALSPISGHRLVLSA